MTFRDFAAASLAVLMVSACGHDYVKVDDMALGKVVVYRNGVAYFQRQARLDGDELTLSVPRDKVDDFLKSLTVKDAETGKTLPVSFPSQNQTAGSMVEMRIKLPGTKSTNVVLTYITEAPAWKPSYRVEVLDDGHVKLEGWAVVDNTSGEDWKDVMVGVGSSSALSFRYDLWSVRHVHRQALASEDQFAVAPPTGQSPHIEEESGVVYGQLGDEEMNLPKDHPDANDYSKSQTVTTGDEIVVNEPAPTLDASESVARYDADYGSGGSGGSGSYSGSDDKPKHKRRIRSGKSKVAKKVDREAEQRRAEEMQRLRDERQRQAEAYRRNQQYVQNLAGKLKASKGKVVIEGYAKPGESDPDARSLDRANVLRNQLIANGVPPARVKVRGVGVKEGRPAGVRVVAEKPAGKSGPNPAEMDADPVGESHFESGVPMSVQRGSSVMVSIVNKKTLGEVVYLYDAESERGNQKYAFKAVRLLNPTKSSLEMGPVTVYGDDRFIGEGLTDPIPGESTALIPFALDRQIVVERGKSSQDRIAKLVTLQRGILTTEVQHLRRTKLKFTNRQRLDSKVFIRHTVQDGWELTDAPKRVEKLGDAHLFAIDLGGFETKTIIIEEATPLTKTVDLRSDAALEMVEAYLSQEATDEVLAAKMRALLTIHQEIADHQQAITSLRERMADYRVRMDELHGQIVTLKAVKSGGSLMKHLKNKLKDVSERVQKATIEVVDHQEALMLARVKFQDAVAELTLVPAEGEAPDEARPTAKK